MAQAESSADYQPTHGEHMAANRNLLAIMETLPEELFAKKGGEYAYRTLLNGIAYYLDTLDKTQSGQTGVSYHRNLYPLIDDAVRSGDFRELNEFLVRFYIGQLEQLGEGDEAVSGIIALCRRHVDIIEDVLGKGDKFAGEAAFGVAPKHIPQWWLSAQERGILDSEEPLDDLL